ncbi:MAG: hypothetical protein JWN98_1480 [Abditibacteriota bacterium]|nr:hypothetical protein [Abditibacteriota bacterium]
MSNQASRRDFIKSAAGVGATVALATSAVPASAQRAASRRAQGKSVMDLVVPAMPTVRLGFIGVGGRGSGLLSNFLKIEGVAVKAICDVRPAHADRAKGMVVAAGQSAPETYTLGNTDFKRMCRRRDLDAIVIATPWEWHVPMAVEAMNAGQHAFIEVPAAVTLEECWQLVDTAEKTQRHCMMLENCCYGEAELMVLNMARQGLFGELLHAEGAYLHDLRGLLLSGQGEGLWRTQHSIKRNGNLYPTHGLGPIAQVLGINRSDRFDYVVSMSSPARGLSLYAQEKFGANDPRAKPIYKNGDMNTSLIKTSLGRTIMVQHDTENPHPYDRINLVQGTKGVVRGYPDRIHIEGRTKGEDWEPLGNYRNEFGHPLWTKIGELAKQHGGHGGMDFVMCWRLIHCLRNGLPLDQSVYDAAAWSAIGPLSEWSVAHGSRPAACPDFTRGAWKKTAPLLIQA